MIIQMPIPDDWEDGLKDALKRYPETDHPVVTFDFNLGKPVGKVVEVRDDIVMMEIDDSLSSLFVTPGDLRFSLGAGYLNDGSEPEITNVDLHAGPEATPE